MTPACRDFDDSTLSPSQHYTAQRSNLRQRPEYRIMIAMLGDAINCYERWMMYGAPPAPVTPESLIAWFHEDGDRSYLYSFQNICLHLDIQPAAVLARLREFERGAAHETDTQAA